MRVLGGLAWMGIVCGSFFSCADHRWSGGATPALPSSQGWHVVSDVVFTRQSEPRTCGVAALAMVLGRWQANVDKASIHRLVGPIVRAEGVPAGALRGVARAKGFEAFLIEGSFAGLEYEVLQGRPVVVGVAKAPGDRLYPHYVVVVGINQRTREVLIGDPAVGWRRENRSVFEADWAGARHLSLIVLAKSESVRSGL